MPTRRGWLLLLLVAGCVALILIRSIQPFFAVSAPVTGGVLVAEGWLADYALQAAVDEYQRGGYEGFYVTGIPLEKARRFPSIGRMPNLGRRS